MSTEHFQELMDLRRQLPPPTWPLYQLRDEMKAWVLEVTAESVYEGRIYTVSTEISHEYLHDLSEHTLNREVNDCRLEVVNQLVNTIYLQGGGRDDDDE